MIYIPKRRLVNVSLSLGEIAPPNGFNFPTMANYVAGTASSLQQVNSFSKSDLAQMFTPPTVSSGTALKATMESAVGSTLNSIVASASSGNVNVVSLVSDLTTNLLMGAVDIVASQVGSSVSSAVGSSLGAVCEVIPVLGQVVSAVVGVLVDFFSGELERQQEERQRVITQGWDKQSQDCLNSKCQKLTNQCMGRATMVTDNGITMSPADSFRQIAYAMNGYSPLPVACPSAMYVLLCGAEDPGIGIDRQRYNAIVDKVRKQTGDPKMGLPQHVQRTMAKLIIGICQSVTSPEAGFIGAPIKDQGRSLYPLLIDLVYNHWKPFVVKNNRKVDGYWDETLLYALVDDMLGSCQVYSEYAPHPLVRDTRIITNCNFIGSLYKATGFMKMIGEYESNLRWNFALPDGTLSPTIVNGQTKSRLASLKKNARLTMSSTIVKKLLSNDEQFSSSFLIGTGMLLSGALAWQGGKYLALHFGTHRKHR